MNRHKNQISIAPSAIVSAWRYLTPSALFNAHIPASRFRRSLALQCYFTALTLVKTCGAASHIKEIPWKFIPNNFSIKIYKEQFLLKFEIASNCI